MTSPALQTAINTWLDAALSQPIASSVVDFSFYLAEPWGIDCLIGERMRGRWRGSY